MNVELESQGDKLNIRALSVELDDDMTCGELLDFIREIEKIATRTSDIKLRKEGSVLNIAMHSSLYSRVQQISNIFTMNVQENVIDLNRVKVMKRDESGSFLKVAENLGDVRAVDPGKPRLLYIIVSRETKLSDVLVALRELKLEPFVLSFLMFRDLDMHAL